MTRHHAHVRALIAVAAGLVVATACETPEQSTAPVCPLSLEARIDRPAVTMRIADSTQLRAIALVCGGTDTLATSWAWTTKDSSIVRVDPSSGWVYGVRAGVTDVLASAQLPNTAVTLSRITVAP
ncbi:MAG: hypothetical protein IT353_06645 [Gemmatimonadaceae bacterium]|nr:hypothetical protein [Gemmatimonadaceae bacterium]